MVFTGPPYQSRKSETIAVDPTRVAISISGLELALNEVFESQQGRDLPTGTYHISATINSPDPHWPSGPTIFQSGPYDSRKVAEEEYKRIQDKVRNGEYTLEIIQTTFSLVLK